MAVRTRQQIEYSPAEEYFNRLSHAVAALASLVGLGVLLAASVPTGEGFRLAGSLVFGVSLVLFYTISTLYHTVRSSSRRALFRKLDHVAIYLLIAGTYTPITLITLRNGYGWTLFAVVWGLAIVGIVQKTIAIHSIPLLGPVLYIALGWLIIIDLDGLLESMPPAGTAWLVAGGISYTVGIFFYAVNRIPHHHGIWHLFVVGGSLCHYVVILCYVIPL